MKRNIFVLMGTVILSVIFVGFTGIPTEAAQFELMLGHSQPMEHHYQKTAEKFAKIVSEKTNGQVNINIFPADQLGASVSQLEAVKVGTQDMLITPDAYLANYDPLFNALGMPYMFASFEAVEKFNDSEAAKFLEEKIEAQGLVILGWNANGFRMMTTNKPILSPADLKGLKLRIGSAKLIAELLSMLGANPTPVAMAETYTALQTGTVDGQENPAGTILSNKLYEVQKHLSVTMHQYVTQPLVINRAKFNSFPPEIQQILRDAAREVAAEDVVIVKNSEAAQVEELKSRGMAVSYPAIQPFKDMLAPLYVQYAEKYGADWKKIMSLIELLK